MERPAATPVNARPAWEGGTLSPIDLVLEGGAMRGQFTAGVLDFFMEQGLFCERVIGVSAGALVGWYYVAGYIGQASYLNIKYCRDWRYLSLRSYALTGNACGREFMFDEVPNRLEPVDVSWFDTSPMSLISVASNLDTGEADYHLHRTDAEGRPYLIASSSMPLVSQIMELDGKHLLDGGTCDSVPIWYSMMTSCNKRIVVTTHDAAYVRKPEKLMTLQRQRYGGFPYFIDRLQHRHFEYNRTYRALARLHEAGEAFVIMPPEPVTVSNLEKDPEKLLALYEQGYRTATETWPALSAYLDLARAR